MICFISGHLDLTEQEFQEHYAPRIDRAIAMGATFVVGEEPSAQDRNAAVDRKAGLELWRIASMRRNATAVPAQVSNRIGAPLRLAGA